MKRLFLFFITIPVFFFGCLKIDQTSGDETGSWPVLKHYDQDHLAKIAMPIGGIVFVFSCRAAPSHRI